MIKSEEFEGVLEAMANAMKNGPETLAVVNAEARLREAAFWIRQAAENGELAVSTIFAASASISTASDHLEKWQAHPPSAPPGIEETALRDLIERAPEFRPSTPAICKLYDGDMPMPLAHEHGLHEVWMSGYMSALHGARALLNMTESHWRAQGWRSAQALLLGDQKERGIVEFVSAIQRGESSHPTEVPTALPAGTRYWVRTSMDLALDPLMGTEGAFVPIRGPGPVVSVRQVDWIDYRARTGPEVPP